MKSPTRLLVLAVAAAIALTGCSDDGGDTTTTIGAAGSTTTAEPTTTATAGDFVFGSGVLPDTLPEDFPVANGATIDSTLVNSTTGFTEVAILVPAEVDVVALFYEQNLQAREYVFDAVLNDGGARWTVSFAKDGIIGSIDIASASAGITRATVTIPGGG